MSQMQSRQIATSVMSPRVNSNLTAMNPRLISTQKMLARQALNNEIQHYAYNQHGTLYNQASYTYNYTSTKGDINPRVLVGVTMRGRY